MNITKNTESYNARRMGKPWIAITDFSKDSKGEYKFGNWIGDSKNGGEGTLEINAGLNDIIAIGQKDNRQPKNSSPEFYCVTEDGKLSYIGDKGAAFKFFKSRPVPALPDNKPHWHYYVADELSMEVEAIRSWKSIIDGGEAGYIEVYGLTKEAAEANAKRIAETLNLA